MDRTVRRLLRLKNLYIGLKACGSECLGVCECMQSCLCEACMHVCVCGVHANVCVCVDVYVRMYDVVQKLSMGYMYPDGASNRKIFVWQCKIDMSI